MPLKHFAIDLFVRLVYDLNMPSLTPKIIDGHTYYYARYCQRVEGKPKIVRQIYLGKIEDLVAAAEGASIPPQPQETVVAAFGDVAALWQIAEHLGVLPLLDSTLPAKRDQGLSCGQYLLLAAINRAVAPPANCSLPTGIARQSSLACCRPIRPGSPRRTSGTIWTGSPPTTSRSSSSR